MLASLYHQRAELLMKSPKVQGPRVTRPKIQRAIHLQNEIHQQGIYT